MYIEDDRKRGQILTSANLLAFSDPDMQHLLGSQDFTIARCVVQVNRLIALGEAAERENNGGEVSEADAAIIQDGKNAKELLYLIEKPID